MLEVCAQAAPALLISLAGEGVKMAAKKRKKGSRRKASRWPVVLGLLVIVMVVMTVGAAALVTLTEARLPPVPTWDEFAKSIPKVTRIRAADNSVIHEVFTERRTLIHPDELPSLLVNAVLAAEDSGFMAHSGLSYAGIARAMLNNLWFGRISQGGSTITQQVVKQVLLTPERTWTRKFKELLLTRRFEMTLSKEEILAMYMSVLYMGHGRYGFEEATRFYFGKRTGDLTLQEAAMLAGMISSPEGNSMIKNPEGALSRQRHVLDQMVENDMITRLQADTAADKTILLWGREELGTGSAPYFVDAVLRELKAMVGRDALYRGGLDVVTTLDPAVSAAASGAVVDGLAGIYRDGRRRRKDEISADRAKNLFTLDEIPDPPETVLLTKDSCGSDGNQMFVRSGSTLKVVSRESLARIGNGSREKISRFCSEIDSILVTRGAGRIDTSEGMLLEVNAEVGPQASFVVIDSSTRAVLAMVGGENFSTRQYNRAVKASMPVGSIIKPFVYTAALADGISEDHGWVNNPVAYRGHGGGVWRPRNYGNRYDGETYDMSRALQESVNVIAVKALKEVGVDKVAALMESFGFSGSIPRDLSMALGSMDATPLEVANAYAVFGSGGRFDTPWMIDQVRDYHGVVLRKHESRPAQVIARPVAKSMKRMLRGVVTDGTARQLADMSGYIWGKTGTTNRSREAWFAGGRGSMVGAVLVAYDDRLPMKGATGGNTAVPVFRFFLNRLLEDGFW